MLVYENEQQIKDLKIDFVSMIIISKNIKS